MSSTVQTLKPFRAPSRDHRLEQLSSYQPVIDALTAHVALLDDAGAIVAVNQAWRRFADENGSRMTAHGVGLNYLGLLEGMSACSSCGPHDDLSYAQKIAEGLRAVLAGREERFQLEYPCDGPDEPRWFLLTLTPFPSDGPVRVVVAHENVTALKLAQRHSLEQAQRLLAAYGGTVRAVALAVEKRDPYTFGHQQQVAQLCEGIAVQLGLDAQRREGLRLGATIHDIGKIFVPAEILNRPGRLTPPELQIIRTHPESGHELLKDIEFPWPIADMVRHHHEVLDGSGYPDHLAGDALCLEVRILTVADVFDAITSHRPYRPAKPFAEGQRALLEGRGAWYDPTVVDALFAHLESARR